MVRPKRVRTVEERLRLFDEHVTDTLSESGGHVGWHVHIDVVKGEVTSTGPGREALRSYFLAVRLLDTPNEPDLYLPNVMDDVESYKITDERRELIEFLRERHRDASVKGDISLEDLSGPITPRDCFELVAYSIHLHRNPDFEARAKAMPKELWAMVEQLARFYAVNISDTAMYLRSIARDDPATTHLFAPAPPGTQTLAERLSRAD